MFLDHAIFSDHIILYIIRNSECQEIDRRFIEQVSHEGLELEDPSNEPNYDDLLVMSTTPEKAPDKAEYVVIVTIVRPDPEHPMLPVLSVHPGYFPVTGIYSGSI